MGTVGSRCCMHMPALIMCSRAHAVNQARKQQSNSCGASSTHATSAPKNVKASRLSWKKM